MCVFLTIRFEARTTEATRLKIEVDAAKETIERAETLLGKLEGEHGRWSDQVSVKTQLILEHSSHSDVFQPSPSRSAGHTGVCGKVMTNGCIVYSPSCILLIRDKPPLPFPHLVLFSLILKQ